MELGDKIRELRIKQDLTQEDLAKQLQITRQTISKWDSNKSVPDIMYVKDLCQIFDISIDEFLSNATYQKKNKKYYYILFIIGVVMYVFPYLMMFLLMSIGESSSSILLAMYVPLLQRISYAFMIASIGFFLFDKWK